MPIRNVSVTEHFDSYIESGIESGRYRDASEVVAEGLRLLEESEGSDQAKLAWLRATTQEAFDALDRGEGIELDDIDEFVRNTVAAGRAARTTSR